MFKTLKAGLASMCTLHRQCVQDTRFGLDGASVNLGGSAFIHSIIKMNLALSWPAENRTYHVAAVAVASLGRLGIQLQWMACWKSGADAQKFVGCNSDFACLFYYTPR